MVCKKPLTEFTSMKIGMGPVCRARYFLQGDLMFENHAAFRIEEEKPGYIFIRDIGHNWGCKTVTNDVSWVLQELHSLPDTDICNKRIFYMDSEGEIDEILHAGTAFISFRHGHEGIKLNIGGSL
jgi:hypothetical protein